MSARVNKIRHDEETRAKIQAGMIIDRLVKCINGDVELSTVQVSAAKALLNKVLPDLQAVSLDAQVEGGMTLTVVSGVPRIGN